MIEQYIIMKLDAIVAFCFVVGVTFGALFLTSKYFPIDKNSKKLQKPALIISIIFLLLALLIPTTWQYLALQ